jgi:transposase
MRGFDERRDGLFSYVRPESRIPKNHPLRVIRTLADEALTALDAQFAELYAENGRPSIPPEQLLRALLLQAFYTIRSERLLMEQLNYNLLFRWFVGLSVDDPVWVPTVFSKNRDRLLEGDIAAAFMSAVLNLPRVQALVSDEHFSVDGTLIKAWASMKSFRRKDGSDEPPTGGTKRRAKLPQGEAVERDARLDHRSRCATCSQIRRPGSEDGLHRPFADGKSEWTDRGCAADAGDRDGGARGRTGHAGRTARSGQQDGRGGQEL